jgi:hypothetical protein
MTHIKRISILICSVSILACTAVTSRQKDPVFAYEGGRVSVVDDYGDCFISIDGPINASLEKAFNKARAFVEEQVCIEKIVLITSHGGDLELAMHIGKEIRSGEYSTDIHQYCESACAFIYMGGIRRFAHLNSRIIDNSKLGVHQPASQLLFQKCINNDPKNGPITQSIRQYLALMLPPLAASTISNEIFDTSCKRISYLDAKTLLRSGIATESVDFH